MIILGLKAIMTKSEGCKQWAQKGLQNGQKKVFLHFYAGIFANQFDTFFKFSQLTIFDSLQKNVKTI